MRFGIGVTEIVPPFPMAMHGYDLRQDNFDDVHDPLTFTAVVIEAEGSRMMFGAGDLCNFPSDGRSQHLQRRLGECIGCPADHIILNASHTHGGPLISSDVSDGSGSKSEAAAISQRYYEWLEKRIVETATQAASNLREGSLWYGQGRTSMTINRRPDRNGLVPNAPHPDGEVDDRLQFLVLKDADEQIKAVGLRMSCHPVATGPQHLLTADFVGAWRAAFADAFGPDVTPFFLQGAAGDIRPRAAANGDEWRRLRHAELQPLGRQLLAEMLQGLLAEPLQRVANLKPRGVVNTVTVPCENRYTTREQFEQLLSDFESAPPEDASKLEVEQMLGKEYARAGIRRLEAGHPMPQEATYHVQTVWLNDELAMIGLDCEPLVRLGRLIEERLAPRQTILLGYTNGCVSYAPDAHEFSRGGYEALAHFAEGWSGPWLEPLEDAFRGALFDPAKKPT